MIDKLSLPAILITEGVVWAGLCCWVNGPAILSYIVLQVLTSGVFAFGVFSVIRAHNERKTAATIDGPRPKSVQGDDGVEKRKVATVA